MIDDLFTDISEWLDMGDQITLTFDYNENITSDTMTELFENLGLTEAITHRLHATGLVMMY